MRSITQSLVSHYLERQFYVHWSTNPAYEIINAWEVRCFSKQRRERGVPSQQGSSSLPGLARRHKLSSFFLGVLRPRSFLGIAQNTSSAIYRISVQGLRIITTYVPTTVRKQREDLFTSLAGIAFYAVIKAVVMPTCSAICRTSNKRGGGKR